MKPAYDFVILGGGLAGLSLAMHLVRSPLCGASILIVERNPAALTHRLWSYWTEQPTPFDPIVMRAWDRLHIAVSGEGQIHSAPGVRFELVRGRDLATFARRELAQHANIDFVHGQIDDLEDSPGSAQLRVAGQAIKARWIFDSTGWPIHSRSPLSMYFDGWMVKTLAPAFEPDVMTFLDMRTPQAGGLRFFYVLPLSERQALVEYVTYGRAAPAVAAAHGAVQSYLSQTLHLAQCDLCHAESGCLPIVTATPSRRLGPHRLAIGARAGLVKPSTGYGFRRIQHDSQAIVSALLASGQPWQVPAVSRRHRQYDDLLLKVLVRQTEAIPVVFAALFARNPLLRVLRFLDETTSVTEDLKLIAALPARPFLSALGRRAAVT